MREIERIINYLDEAFLRYATTRDKCDYGKVIATSKCLEIIANTNTHLKILCALEAIIISDAF